MSRALAASRGIPSIAATAPAPTGPVAAIPSLDGIRALAVSLVFLAHGGLDRIVPGGLGVTVFFVLSGFLITTLLRREFAETGRLDLGAFYLRRLLRLMPPLAIVVGASAALGLAGAIDGRYSVGGLLAVLFYVGNYFVIATDFHGVPPGIGVVWSLAVEEHFYLLFPLLALVLLRARRLAIAGIALGALCVLILLWRCWLASRGATENYIGMATDTRADAILIGCAMALVSNPVLDPVSPPHRGRDVGMALCCLGLLATTLLYRDDRFRHTARYTLQALAIAPLIRLAVARAATVPFRWLSARPLAYLGTISYTVYLSHQVILEALRWHWPQLGVGAALILAVTPTLLFAEAMRRFVERPCARLRRQLHRRSRLAGTCATDLEPSTPLRASSDPAFARPGGWGSP